MKNREKLSDFNDACERGKDFKLYEILVNT